MKIRSTSRRRQRTKTRRMPTRVNITAMPFSWCHCGLQSAQRSSLYTINILISVTTCVEVVESLGLGKRSEKLVVIEILNFNSGTAVAVKLDIAV